MIRLGLTGGIASGKSTVAAMFAREGIPVFNADVAVHRLYRRADVIASIGAAFPGCVQDGKIDRLVLAEEVFFDHAKLHALERLLHPQKPTVVAKKVGRNEPCSCGSKKKFKNCCGK